MTQEIKLVRVFLASPGDLANERRLAYDAVTEINKTIAKRLGYMVDLVAWEDTAPGAGRPQAIINKDLDSCELFIGIIWKKWGTPPDNEGIFSSGFEEEFELSFLRRKNTGKPEMAMYFKQVASEILADPGDDLKKVLAFKDKLIKGKAILFNEFAEPSIFQRYVREKITEYLFSLRDASLQTQDEAHVKPSARNTSNATDTISSLTLKDARTSFLHECEVTWKLSEHTIRAYKRALAVFCSEMDEHTAIKNIDSNIINNIFVAYLRDGKASHSTIKLRFACINRLFNWMVEEGHIALNPVDGIDLELKIPTKVRKNIPYEDLVKMKKTAYSELGAVGVQICDSDSLSNLIASKRDFNKFTAVVVLELLISTELFVNELTAIKEEHIDLDELRLKISGKGQRDRYIRLHNSKSAALIKCYKDNRHITKPDHSYLLVTSRGEKSSPQFIRKLIDKLATKAGITYKVTPAMFRYSGKMSITDGPD